MRFGKTLKLSIYEPWRSNYIDYSKLKALLREDVPEDQARQWTEDDEAKFVEELVNVQLEKVNGFQVETSRQLRDRTEELERQLKDWEASNNQSDGKSEKEEGNQDKVQQKKTLDDILKKLDRISNEISELEKYSRINFTGFLKAAKKHDRKRGSRYRVRPLLQVRLSALPFNSEDYSPLLYRLSTMYAFVRQRRNGDSEKPNSISESVNGKDTYTAHKFFVHPENLLEVKTYILRRLPVLVYNPQTSKVLESGQPDPTITSIYFDNPQFTLYNKKLDRSSGATSLRLRWSGQLDEKPEIFFEKKTVEGDGVSEEERFSTKDKYVQPFINGEYRMEKSVEKIREREGTDGNGAVSLQRSIDHIQAFIRENELQPMVRANYARTAFQIPGDNRLRVSIDTDVAFIREDALDEDRPCRAPDDWHRVDIDRLGLKYPFTEVRQGEVVRFPYAILEVKVKDGSSKRINEWVSDLTSSHLVKEAPRFSKFVHGVAQLFEDYVNSFPFWLSDLDRDIRKDPEKAFEEEQDKKAKEAEDKAAVGSFLGSKSVPSFKAAVGSPVGKAATDFGKRKSQPGVDTGDVKNVTEEADPDDEPDHSNPTGVLSGLLSRTPFSNSKYARAHRQGPVQLPPGVVEPSQYIKDMNPVRVEPKVWLANQRTFIKWQHISVLLATLSLGLYNAAGPANKVASALAVVYTIIALFAGAWGWWVFWKRSQMIEQRSGKDFDFVAGPIVVCLGLFLALILNFGFKYHNAIERHEQHQNLTDTLQLQTPLTYKASEWAYMHEDLR